MEPGSESEGLGKLSCINITAVCRGSPYNVQCTQYIFLFPFMPRLLRADIKIEIVFMNNFLFVWVNFLGLFESANYFLFNYFTLNLKKSNYIHEKQVEQNSKTPKIRL